MKEALYYQSEKEGKVRCTLCPHRCLLAEEQSGLCGVRRNIGGRLYSLVYEKAIALHVDPIEKKPLFHVYPGSSSFSLATMGCNFKCRFCQNHEISQVHLSSSRQISGESVSASQAVQMARQQGCKTLACTYTEPTVFFEYALEIGKKAREDGLQMVWISNGYISAKPLQEIARFLLAANIDLKSWNEDFYRHEIGGDLSSVLETLVRMKKLGVWLEVTTLIIPGVNDSESELQSIAHFIANDLGPETPWHISRFYPHFKTTHLSPTPIEVLHRAREIGIENGLRYVYCGNVPGEEGEHTFCYQCHERIIQRFGFHVLQNKLCKGCCPVCSAPIDGIFS
ncbi:MAG TPA: AmmeMemoRadiSam system radical SAM enzyme [bacterium]|nr:AmmeMemoRadiSam system radical SAM enzyme [bacterium]HNT64441.1 AmmeMemoRadiSam system radical SAM enzyme [bacterium]